MLRTPKITKIANRLYEYLKEIMFLFRKWYTRL